MADCLDLVVHPLEGRVADAKPRPGEDPTQVVADHPGESDEGCQPTPEGPSEPPMQVRLGPATGEVVPETLEGLLQVVGAHDGQVLPAQLAQTSLLLRTQVPWVLQPQPPRSLELGLLLLRQLPPSLAPHVVHGSVQVLDDVEAVEDHNRLGQVL